MTAQPTELLLVRHGETAAGDDHFVAGQRDPALSPRGVEQALRTARRLEQQPLAGIFVTPLRRTVETARPLVESTGVGPTVVPSLREVELGDLDARFAVDPRAAMREVLRRQRWDVGTAGEAPEAFAARVADGLAQVAGAVGPGRRAVAFVHGGVIAEACRQATGSRRLAFLPHLHHASITRLWHGEKRMTLELFNDVSHLGRAS
jgi:probable phosphoglycerate mutase